MKQIIKHSLFTVASLVCLYVAFVQRIESGQASTMLIIPALISFAYLGVLFTDVISNKNTARRIME